MLYSRHRIHLDWIVGVKMSQNDYLAFVYNNFSLLKYCSDSLRIYGLLKGDVAQCENNSQIQPIQV